MVESLPLYVNIVCARAYGKDSIEAVNKVKTLVEIIKAAVKLIEKRRKK